MQLKSVVGHIDREKVILWGDLIMILVDCEIMESNQVKDMVFDQCLPQTFSFGWT